MGGLSTASLLSQCGKKVLVLEKHDRAGGSAQIFKMNGFEFDVGLHYVGELDTELGVVMDTVFEGRVAWKMLDDPYDTVAIYNDGDSKKYPIRKGDNRVNDLYRYFPNDSDAVTSYLDTAKELAADKILMLVYTLMPRWLYNLIVKFDLHNDSGYFKLVSKTVESYLKSLTNNKDLQTVLSYNYGDFGDFPSKASILMNTAVFGHYQKGAYYPIGGTSQMVSNIIQKLEERGSKVLVNANVTKVLLDETGKKAIGVEVTKGDNKIQIHAPIIVSATGAYNTYKKLLNEVYIYIIIDTLFIIIK